MKKYKTLSLALSVVLSATIMAGCASAPAPAPAPEAAAPAPAADAGTPAAPAAPEASAGKVLPQLSYIYNYTNEHALIAQAIQEMWKQEFGLDVRIEEQEWAVLQTNRTEGNYELSRHGWLGDYIDPMTFLDLFVSNTSQNDPNYKNPEFDELIATAKSSIDQKERMDAMHKAESLLMGDMAVIPIYHYTNTWVDNGKVTGSVFDPLLGNSFFMWASKDDGTPIKYGIGASPKTLDPQLNNATDGANYVQSCFEGLTRKNKNNEVEPGVATSWDVSDDGLTWTFHLRDNAKWSDGQPVTAKDFVFAWQRAVDPASACDYAYQLWYVKNGEKITNGELDKAELGVKAIDDKTLEVVLEAPCGYFTQMTAFPTLYPVREDIVASNEGWANSPATYIGNGPYLITEFTPSDKIVFKKNENFWDAANYPCPDLIVYMTDDSSALLAAFETGEMDIVEEFPVDEVKRLKEAGYYKVEPLVGTYYVCVNMESNVEALNDLNVRKALALTIDREYLVEFLDNGAIPAYSFVPPGVPDADGKDFYDNSPKYFGSGDYLADCEEARRLLQESGYDIQ